MQPRRNTVSPTRGKRVPGFPWLSWKRLGPGKGLVFTVQPPSTLFFFSVCSNSSSNLLKEAKKTHASQFQGACRLSCRSLARHVADQKPVPIWQMLQGLLVESWWWLAGWDWSLPGRQADRPSYSSSLSLLRGQPAL